MALFIAADHRYTPTSVGTDKGAHYHREVNMFGPNTLASMELATSHGITPDRCNRCGSQTGNWRGPLVDGATQETDDGALLWECRDCGNFVSRTAEQVKVLAMHVEHEREHGELVQVVELVGEPYTNERWIFVPAHLAEHGKERHVVLSMGAEEALRLAETLYGMVRVDMMMQQQAVGELRTQLK